MKNRTKLTVSFFAAFILLFAAVVAPRAAFADSAVAWGLKPNTQGKTPEPPPEGVKLLAAHDGVFTGDTAQNKVYFTFDLGYEAGYTDRVLDILDAHGIKAVFFLCGNYLKQTDLIRRMIASGHSLGNHTDKHKDLPTLSDAGIDADIGTLQQKFAERFDAPMRFFRPPQGRFCARTLTAAQTYGLKTVLWSIAIADWGKEPIDAPAAADKIASRLHPGAIILSHITNAGTPEMLKLLLPKIVQKGYVAGSPSDL